MPLKRISYTLSLNKNILWTLIFVGIAATISAQVNRISWEYNYDHFGIKNGLPSSETYQIHQDKSGLLWILTDRGVVKYDGFEFQKYTTENGLCDNVNFRVVEDDNGGIWFVGFNGLLSVFKDGKMQAYKYNHVLRKAIVLSSNTNISIHVNKDNSVVYCVFRKKIISVSKDGKVKDLAKGVVNIGCFLEFGNDILCLQKQSRSGIIANYYFRNKKLVFAGNLLLSGTTRLKKHKNFCFVMSDYKLYLNDGEKFKPLVVDHQVISLDSDKQFLYVGMYKNGMNKYRFDPKTKELALVRHYLPGCSVSSTYKDSNGTLWITTLEKGLFAIYDEAFKQLAINGKNLSEEVRFINGNKQKVVVTHYVGKWQQLYPPFLCKDAGKIVYRYNLLPVGDGFLFRKDIVDWSDWKDVNATSIVNPIYANDSCVFGILNNTTKDRIVKMTKSSLFVYKIKHLQTSKLIGSYLSFHFDSSKKVFVLFHEGVFVFDVEGPNIANNYRTVLRKRINEIKYNKAWGLIAYSGFEGLFQINMKEEKYAKFAPGINIGTQISSVFFDEKNQLWIASEKGIFVLVKKEGKITVKSFLNKKLLSSSEIMSLYAYKDVLYLATKFGVQKINFREIKKEKFDCPLSVFSIRAFAKNEEIPGDKVFSANTDLIKIRLSNKYLSKYRVYRYRFGKDQTWIKSDKGEIILNNPTDRKYDLEISYLDNFDSWTKPVHIAGFEVVRNVFLRWYFMVVYALIVIILFYIILKLSIRYVNKKNYILNRMIELEQMALSAQMNPHFIFNSLNSIHSFLLFEENENAEKYLIRFSKLIRQTLGNSRKQYITLEEECEMLKNYILLEQMRFKSTFTFEIDCDLKRLPFHPFIPPMLIQPYVENAIIHGLIKREEGAKLFLKFYMEDQLLHVLIEDNGIGYSESMKRQRDTGHKSYGTQITEERLKSLKGKNKEGYSVAISNVDDSNPEFPGTRVILTIPIPN
ncbi:Sensor histidine kinase YehU [compost metagenome]